MKMKFTCNQCGNEMKVFPAGITEDNKEVTGAACSILECPNYGLLQVPSEIMLLKNYD